MCQHFAGHILIDPSMFDPIFGTMASGVTPMESDASHL
jgi:hypothetical protein